MLQYLQFQDVGPAPHMEIAFHERMNFLVGDNGLGKTFLLDAAWWALTRTWARQKLMPHRPPTDPRITYRYTKKSGGPYAYTSRFDRESEHWPLAQGRPPIPGLVLYAQVDGGFSVWDPARNYWKGENPDRQPAYLFSPQSVWDGLPLNEPVKYCNGLITDWANWQLENGQAFKQLRSVLRALSPGDEEPLESGALVKVSLGDARKHPSIKMPYGLQVPLIHASAGIRRIVSLGYLLVWAWQEHLASAELQGITPAREIVFLIDEVEAHLHPQWQRRIVPALLDVMAALTGEHTIPVQLITATHSPLVLASSEPRFDDRKDAIWELDLTQGEVQLRAFPWSRRGDANAWLTSSAFDLKEPRSLEAERAITQALALLRQESPPPAEIDQVDAALRGVLSDIDRFWVRWSHYRESRQGHGS
ncbi:MAG: ATP-binding protein [Chromatiaceae bacterium]|mgnify:CR=1 FL=1|nr:ATP-binding protein [Chromatiaceae bacterium]MBP6733781.1 ATP-binding protein [Chromatiaceae bacterium]MBP8288941.1 ATP-binding protein [Chromatiaceae bacterium]